MSLHNDLIELYQSCVNLSAEERIARAQESWGPIFEFIDRQDLTNENKGAFFVYIFKYFVSADRNMTTPEFELFKGVTGCDWSEEDFYEMTNHGSDEQFRHGFEAVVDSMPNEIKAHVATVGLCILAADDSLTREEQDLFERFLSSNN